MKSERRRITIFIDAQKRPYEIHVHLSPEASSDSHPENSFMEAMAFAEGVGNILDNRSYNTIVEVSTGLAKVFQFSMDNPGSEAIKAATDRGIKTGQLIESRQKD
jgi:hypothetical protein